MARKAFFLLTAAVVCAVILLPHPDPHTTDLVHTFAAPSREHLLGTDNLGRDVYARMISGLWRTLLVTGVAAAMSVTLGTVCGIIAGLGNRVIRRIVMGFTDVLMIVPTFIAALIVAAFVGLTPLTAGISLGLFGIGTFVNQTEALTSRLVRTDFVQVERLLGTPWPHVIRQHLIPHVLGAVATNVGSTMASVAISYAGLAFIGLGVDTSTPDWGTMLYAYREELTTHPLLVLSPIIGILWISLLCHLLFDRGTHPEVARV